MGMLSVSLDVNMFDWKKGIRSWKIPGMHACDFNRFKSEQVKKFFIYKTPFMLLIDSEGKILKRNPSIEQMKHYLTDFFKL